MSFRGVSRCVALEPKSLPRSIDELAQWRVFADALLERGDRLGELIAVDLALGRAPSSEDLRRFWSLTRRRCRPFRFFDVAWCLGFARSIHVKVLHPPGLVLRRRNWDVPSAEQLRDLRQFLSTPRASFVEELRVPADLQTIQSPEMQQVFANLPLSCTTLRLDAYGMCTASDGEAAVASLPRGIRRLRLRGRYGTVIDGFVRDPRLEVDLRRWQWADSPYRTAATIVSYVADARVIRDARIGLAGDAALLQRSTRALTVVERVDLLRLQARHDIISAQAQVERLIPEGFDLITSDHLPTELRNRLPPLRVGSGTGSQLMRRGDGTWTIAAFAPSDMEGAPPALRVCVGGAPLEPGKIAPLPDEAPLMLNDEPYLFFHDVAKERWKLHL